MSRVTSASNPIVQRLRRLSGRRSARADERAFVVEGPGLLADALAAGVDVEVVLAAADDPVLDVARAAGATVVEASAEAVQAASSTATVQPVVAVARWCDAPLDALDRATFVVVCAGLADPGNVGTLLRSAEAAGAGAVVVGRGSVDAFNPKVVRAAAGSLFRVPVVVDVEVADALARLGSLGTARLGTVARGGRPYDAVDLTAAVALVLGSEAHGLDPDLAGFLDGTITIPMAGSVESLNVGVAGAVACFEVARQRRGAAPPMA